MNTENYMYVDIFDIPDVMKVRTQYKIANEAVYGLPIIKRDAVVKLAEEIQPFVHHREEMDFGTYERTITDTLFVIPPDCKRLAIPKKETEWIPEKGKWTNAYDGNDGHVKCTACFKTYDYITQAQHFNYCPNCGAKMEVTE